MNFWEFLFFRIFTTFSYVSVWIFPKISQMSYVISFLLKFSSLFYFTERGLYQDPSRKFFVFKTSFSEQLPVAAWYGKTWVKSYYLRVESLKLRAEIEVQVQTHELQVQIHELLVKIQTLRVQLQKLRVQIYKLWAQTTSWRYKSMGARVI